MNYRHWLLPVMLIALSACDNNDKTFMVGTLERDRVEVSAESNEPIIAIHVSDGQMLETGDLMFEQDPARLENLLAQQIALKAQSAARLAELQRGPRPETIREARAQLESAQASAKNAAANLKRAQDIFDRDLSDQQSLDLATTRRKTAVAAEQAAAESLERLLNGTTVEELQQAAAALEATEAGVARIQLDIERLQIHAPVDGMLDKRLYQIGERPLAGATIGVVLDSSRTYARIYVPETLRSSVQPGRKLDVRIDGQERVFEGTVRWVSADASFTPYFALTEHDRSRLSYLAEVDVPGASSLPSGVPLEVDFPVAVSADD
ncbi:MAG: HlyD family efflux transporter periplasmic adaptor subunit [Xanthomonadales bacterium]|nr:HlyD family efflux transporter periplasmic adaptor subunit [Gammaproteobacteria bacterium]NNK04938.1 HlyD family efflux transporter periplasmic adaptor subunit [Xanthomonadales bacterium]